MAFKLDKNNTGFKPLEKGEYEVYPHKLAKETAKSGNKMAQFNYIIRDDVDQEGKGQEIRFDNFVESENSLWRLNQASEAANMDMEAEYEDIWAWGEAFKNKAVRVVVGHREYQGKTYPQVESFKPSLYGGEYEGKEEKDTTGSVPKNNEQPIDISDDDLPF